MTEIDPEGNHALRPMNSRKKRGKSGKGPALSSVLKDLKACRVCADRFEHEPRPLFQIENGARIAIFGQAPGNRAHQLGQTFLDPSGVRLREWLGVDDETFYDPQSFMIVPMAFCFPGYDAKGGDKPPPKICAKTWRATLFDAMERPKLTLLVGRYAQAWELGAEAKPTLTETVAAWRDYAPSVIPLPHPSWRNNAWIKKQPWFETELLPYLKKRVRGLLKRG